MENDARSHAHVMLILTHNYSVHRDGWILWKSPVPGDFFTHLSNPPSGKVTDSNEHIYVLTRNTVSVFQGNGELLWTWSDPEEHLKTMVLSMDRKLYVIGSKTIYAFQY